MSDLEIALLAVLTWINGFVVAYIWWAPETPFKSGLMDGLTLRWLWKRK